MHVAASQSRVTAIMPACSAPVEAFSPFSELSPGRRQAAGVQYLFSKIPARSWTAGFELVGEGSGRGQCLTLPKAATGHGQESLMTMKTLKFPCLVYGAAGMMMLVAL